MLNEPETFEEKLEDVEESTLAATPKRASQGVHDVFEKVYGEILIDEPGAPERNDYDEQEQGYERYLHDLHAWARENYEEAVDELVATVDDLDDQEFPELGMQRIEDEKTREESEDAIVDAKARLLEVIEWRKKVNRIEDGFADRQ